MKALNQNHFMILIALLFAFSSCNKSITPIDVVENETNIESLTASPDFNWKTSNTINFSIQTLDNAGIPVANVKLFIATDYIAEGGKVILSGSTNADGLFQMDYNIASTLSTLVVGTNFQGFPSEVQLPIENNTIQFTMGGIPPEASTEKSSTAFKSSLTTKISFNTLGSWLRDGTPRYLERNGDHISSDFLEDINTALPEYQPVPDYHPEYLLQEYDQNIHLVEDADVWVTFVSEGAGNLNTLAYYTFDTNNPPQSIEEINSATIIFPNTSMKHSGGGLYSGDKVHIGHFSAGTSIGCLLIANGYNSLTKQVTDGDNYFFSTKTLNPETDASYKQHVVLLKDAERDLFIFSFEDLKRPDGDNDFNDAVFYMTTDPITAVDDKDIIERGEVIEDTDGDGVADYLDEYPEDGNVAFNNYYPNEGDNATLAFEDLWPAEGDYDFNDLVIDYNFNLITNANNEVLRMRCQFEVKNVGGSHRNGFGFEMENILSDQVSSVSGNDLAEGYTLKNSAGAESGQTHATIIVFDNAWRHFSIDWNGADGIDPNTLLDVMIEFKTPIAISNFGLAPFNPFIIVNKTRGREVHLPNYSPTDLADASFFGTIDDNTIINDNNSYKTIDNLPWAINIPVSFQFPYEKEAIDKAYQYFIPWVESSGTDYTDWYLKN